MNGSYNTNKNQISHDLECFNSLLDEHSRKYENYAFIGDFNVNTSDSSMKEFYSLNGLKNLTNETKSHLFNTSKSTCIILSYASPMLLNIGTTKTMTMMSLDLKFKPFVL